MRPLNGPAYGSIGHLSASKLGEGDHHISPGQERILLAQPRKGDVVIVQEKLDGACVSVANVDGKLVALMRAGYTCETSSYKHIRLFHYWFEDHRGQFERLDLRPGERVVGEWLAMAHGVKYRPPSPFAAFDIIDGAGRVPYSQFRSRVDFAGLLCAPLISVSSEGCPLERAQALLGERGFFGAQEAPEGLVYRVERGGRVDFLAKWVRHDMVCGRYFSKDDSQMVWNWEPHFRLEA